MQEITSGRIKDEKCEKKPPADEYAKKRVPTAPENNRQRKECKEKNF